MDVQRGGQQAYGARTTARQPVCYALGLPGWGGEQTPFRIYLSSRAESGPAAAHTLLQGGGSLAQELQGLALTSSTRAAAASAKLSSASSASPFSTPPSHLLAGLLPGPALAGTAGPAATQLLPPTQAPNTSSAQPAAEICSAPVRASSLVDSTSCLQLSSALTSGPAGLNSLSGGQATSSLAIPPHGVKAVCGKRAKMEDAFSVQTNFMDVQMSPADSDFQNKLPARIASQIGEQLDQQTSPPSSLPLSPNSTIVAQSLSTSDNDPSVGGSSSSDSGSCADTLHFFGVYDGHGGVEASQHCANRLHHHLSIALALLAGSAAAAMHTHDAFCVAANPNGGGRGGVQCQAEWTLCSQEGLQPCPDTPPPLESSAAQEHGSAAVDRLFRSSTAAASGTQAPEGASAPDGHMLSGDQAQLDAGGAVAAQEPQCGGDGDSASSGSDAARSDTALCMTAALENALRSAFLKTDEEFAEDGSSAMVGSTAVVALVGTKKMWIANCGDSRAVLCRGGRAIQVTDDHKPEREDEAERVEKAGGQVLYWNGHRVMGVLAMSRAIGDHGLRPYVIPEPEITVLSRVVEDDFLLLASDGLWDVMSNQEAIQLAMRCLQRSWDKGTSRKAAVRVAATVLTRAAVDRGSKDNVTVVIIDLKAPQPTSSDGVRGDSLPCCDPCLGVALKQDSFEQPTFPRLQPQDTLVDAPPCVY